MSTKLAPLGFSRKIPRWVSFVAHLSSLPCTIDLEAPPCPNPPDAPDYEFKIKFLSNKLVPDSLIRVLDTTSDVESAVRIFNWASLQKNFHHTADSYRLMILKLGSSGNIDLIEEICQRMIFNRCPGAENVLDSLVGEFVRFSKLNESIRILENMIRGGHKPSIESFNAVFGLIVEERRELKEFMFVYKEMVKAGRVPNIDTLNYLLEALFDAGKVDTALDQYRRLGKKGCSPDSNTFELLIMNLIAVDRVGDSINVLQEMFVLGLVPDLRFYTSVIPLICREDQLEESMKLFKMMKDSNFAPNLIIYTSLIHRLCNNFFLDDAKNLLQDMIDGGLVPTDDVFKDIVVGFCRADRIHEAIVFLEDKQVSSSSAHNAVLEYCCSSGRVFFAQNLLDEMSDRGVADSDSWNVPIHWLCEHGHLRQALQILTRMIVSSSVPNPATYSALVLGYCKLGKHDLKQPRLLHVVLAQMLVGGCPISWESYSILIKSMCSCNQVEEAALLFDSIVDERFCPESESLLDMLLVFSRHSKLSVISGAIDKLGEILNLEMFNLLIKGFLKEGKESEARKLLDSMLEKGWVPDRTTHSLLMLVKPGGVPTEQDNISNILSEGLDFADGLGFRAQ